VPLANGGDDRVFGSVEPFSELTKRDRGEKLRPQAAVSGIDALAPN
jgi:hypothetical protein